MTVAFLVALLMVYPETAPSWYAALSRLICQVPLCKHPPLLAHSTYAKEDSNCHSSLKEGYRRGSKASIFIPYFAVSLPIFEVTTAPCNILSEISTLGIVLSTWPGARASGLNGEFWRRNVRVRTKNSARPIKRNNLDVGRCAIFPENRVGMTAIWKTLATGGD